MAFKQEVNVPLILTIGVISGVMVLVLVIGTQAWYQDEEIEQSNLVNSQYPISRSVDELKLQQTEAINTYAWVDKQKGVVAIPIDKAMDILVRDKGKLPSTEPSGQ